MSKIFISYAHEDQDRVIPLYWFLRLLDYQPWMDAFDLVAGQRWESSIMQAIKQANFILVAFSSHSARKRGFIRKEIRIALDLANQLFDDDPYLIPVRLDDCECPDELSKFQYVDMFKADGLLKLIEALEIGREKRDIRPPGESQAINLVEWLGKYGSDVRMSQRCLEFNFSDTPLQCMFDTRADRMRVFAPVAPRTSVADEEVKRLLVANYSDTGDARYACDGDVVYAAFLHPLSSLSEAEFYRGARCVHLLYETFETTRYCDGFVEQEKMSSHGTTKKAIQEWIEDNGFEARIEENRLRLRHEDLTLELTFRRRYKPISHSDHGASTFRRPL